MKRALAFLISGILLWETIRLLQDSGPEFPFLSHREREILSLIAEGYSEDEISEHLQVGKRRLGKYISNIPRRLNLPDISYAIEYAIEKGLVSITYA